MKRFFLIFFLVFSLSKNIFAFEPKERLETLRQRMSSVLDMIAEESKAAAERLSDSISKDEAKSVLSDLCSGLEYSVDCAYVNEKGVLKYIEPEAYRKFEGKNIARQDQFRQLRKTRSPVFSKVFRAVEGFDAIDYEYPVFNSKKQWKGAVSVLMKPADFIHLSLQPEIESLPYEIMVMQTDGLILYSDEEEIGRNIFTDPMYKDFPSLIELCRRIVKEESGEGTYSFKARKTGRIIEKKAHWTTVRPGDNTWRMVMIVEEGQ